ncbi:Gfo/Idh/MocA family protein [Natronobacterium gregoryi]|uniref:Dehydrogenase n=2 Tax=Natronobacterium gregoryi TaxID=44930 RepID=L0AM54_NATGS|nr:Gfo/Idh/MocA family oxidoreductase [Natronobacterium gregoryi]AFZ74105.1 putative dehydrogenase [Natronobacterium gregoryi SP2]ELY63841.1 oxidoreductase domain-containing protein [Natronobacterium gregoryi SP2]PLK18717.1 gfo/Idh/MocA family oxidoreductase [Natronobacterium gregoryi SP2]SFJ67005.1 Predicted dehydrogenase [Natronobacterium gregoryi]
MLSLPFSRRTDSSALTLGVLGVGNIGMVHLKSARAMADVEVVAAADPVLENRRRAERAGVARTYDDYATLLDAETLDAAVVALPPILHLEAVERAAAAGVDVFVEKPLARSTDEAEQLLETAESAGIAVGVDHTLRYQPDVAGVREEYEDGAAGHVPYASLVRLNDSPLGRPPVEDAPPSWPLDPDAAGGGSLLELGIHCFDVLYCLFGDLEVRSAAVGNTLELPVEDAATVLMYAPETETTITLHCGSYQWEELPEVNTRLRLEGVTGTISNADHLPDNFYADAAKEALTNVTSRVTDAEPTVFGPTFYLRAHYRALEDFCEAVRADERPPVDGELGLQTLELAESAYELAAETDDERGTPTLEVTR